MQNKFFLRLWEFIKYYKEKSTLNLIRSSDLFDEDWYLAKNPDVVKAMVNPLIHFLHHGGFEERDPSPNFCSSCYLDTYEDVKTSGINPLVHFLRYGEKEGRVATCHKETQHQKNEITYSSHEQLEPDDIALIGATGLFDEAWYLAHNPDVFQAGIDPLFHFLNYGGFEGRNPGPVFRSTWYMNTYDIKSDGINPLVHYIKYGREAGYRTQPLHVNEKKIFGVGFSKTGTTSLEEALHILGHNVCRGHWRNHHTFYLLALYIHRDYEEIFRMVNYWDAFADGPWGGTDLYNQLYKRLPESKFILTIRDAESWYLSFEKLITKVDQNLETALDSYHKYGMYGSAYYFKHIFNIETLAGNKQKIIDHYNAYNENIINFFSKKHADFLILNMTSGDGWEKLCKFLDQELPDQVFPHLNKTK